MSHDEISFCELKAKEIVNEVDGRKLGKTIDLVFSPGNGCILGIIAPHTRRSFFFKGQEIFIPFKNICKIGPDVVLVRLTPDLSRPDDCIDVGRGGKGRDGRRYAPPPPPPPPHKDNYDYADEHDRYDGHGEEDYRDNRPPPPPPPPPPPHGPGDGCDFKCEKCMLFDCAKRWKHGVKGGGSAYVDGKLYK